MKALTSAVVGGRGGGDRLLDAAIDDDGYEWEGGEYLDI